MTKQELNHLPVDGGGFKRGLGRIFGVKQGDNDGLG